MSLAHCADLLASGDPERFMALRGATPAAQARLLPIHALALEIGRAAWASQQPLVAEMRLQWWADALDELGQGAAVRAHPVLAASGFLAGDAAGVAVLQAVVEARRRDVWREDMVDEAGLWAHLDATGAGVMWLAARALGAGAGAEPVLRDYGAGVALAGWLRAVPGLTSQGITALPDAAPAAVAGLARAGLARIAAARAQRRRVPAAALPALLTGWQAPALLAQAAAEPGRVAAGRLGLSEFGRRGRLAWVALSGRW